MNSSLSSSLNLPSRRDFIKAGFALGAGFSLADLGGLFAPEAGAAPAKEGKPLIAAVRDASRAAMLDKALELLGGIGAFVKPGQTVVIKPNAAWATPPERGANTHPELLKRIIWHCKQAGAKSIKVFERTCDGATIADGGGTLDANGIRAAVKEAGVELVPGNDRSYYKQVAVKGVKLKEAEVHRLILESDVFINVPVLKHHQGTTMTAAMKNLMGIIWDRRAWHRLDLHQCIADFLTAPHCRPTLNITDAYAPMLRYGPRGHDKSDLIEMRSLLASPDIVAIDAAGAKMLGHKEDGIGHVKIASDAGYGTCRLGTVNIARFKFS